MSDLPLPPGFRRNELDEGIQAANELAKEPPVFTRREQAALLVAGGVGDYSPAEVAQRAVARAEAVLAASGGRERQIAAAAAKLDWLAGFLDDCERTPDEHLPANEKHLKITLTDNLARELAGQFRFYARSLADAAGLDPPTPEVS